MKKKIKDIITWIFMIIMIMVFTTTGQQILQFPTIMSITTMAMSARFPPRFLRLVNAA